MFGGRERGEQPNVGVGTAAAQGSGGQGPNLTISGQATVQNGLDASGMQAAGVGAGSGQQVALKVKIRNRGDRTSKGSRLIIKMDPYGGVPTIESSWSGCLTCPVTSRVISLSKVKDATESEWPPVQEVCQGNDCHVEVLLGDLPPGANRRLLMVWKAPAGQEFNFDLRMESNNGGGSSLQTKAFRMRRPPVITGPRPGTLGWRGCLTCTVRFKGFAEPGVAEGLYSKDFDAGNLSTTADDKGFWRSDARLLDGTYEVLAWTGCLTCTVTAQE